MIQDKFGNQPSQGFFAIYDGHAGIWVSEYLAKTLHLVTRKIL